MVRSRWKTMPSRHLRYARNRPLPRPQMTRQLSFFMDMQFAFKFYNWSRTSRGQRLTHSSAVGSVLMFFSGGVVFSMHNGWIALVFVVGASILGLFSPTVTLKCLSLLVLFWGMFALFDLATRQLSKDRNSERSQHQTAPQPHK
jgi:hypothetical protein